MKKKKKSVTGTAQAGPSINSHWDGWNAALDDALKKTGWKSGDYDNVHIEFFANVKVVNPGNIVEYAVKLTPGG
ncbi:MAG TPA: hypothetical protein VIE38_01290 [Gaiellaceae bacterium]|jgi:hypothetical protein